MKKNYEKPFVEKIEFDYTSQVVATSSCSGKYTQSCSSDSSCEHQVPYSNVTNQA